MTQEALKLALEALEDRVSLMKWQKARDAVKEALAQHDSVQAKPEPEQEPVKYSDYEPDGVHHNKPPQRTFVGLTEDEIKTMDAGLTSNASFYAGALWAEAKLKEKNNAT